MNSYENEIMAKLQGDTPKQKYENLMELITIQQDYKDLSIKLKKAAKEHYINVSLSEYNIIVHKL